MHYLSLMKYSNSDCLSKMLVYENMHQENEDVQSKSAPLFKYAV